MSEEKLSLDIGVNANAGVIDTLISALNELSQQLSGVTGKFTTVTAKVDQLGTKSTNTAKDVHKASDSVDERISLRLQIDNLKHCALIPSHKKRCNLF